jgi:HEAT repeat protein
MSSSPESIEALLEYAKSSAFWQRLYAARCLGKHGGDAEAILALQDLMRKDPKKGVQRRAARTLGQLGDKSALPHLLATIQDPRESSDDGEIKALLPIVRQHPSLIPEVVRDLTKLLDSVQKERQLVTLTCKEAARVLGEIGSPNALSSLHAFQDRFISYLDNTMHHTFADAIAKIKARGGGGELPVEG